MKLPGAHIRAFIRGSLSSTSLRSCPLRTDLRVLVSAPRGPRAGRGPGSWNPPSGPASSQVPPAARHLPLPLSQAPTRSRSRAHGRCLHSQEAPAPGGATSLHPQGPPPWSHPTSRLPGRAGSTPTPLACLCMALPECQAASWPPLWGSVLSSRRWASFLRMSSGALLQQKQRRHAPSLALTPEVSALGTFV